MRGDGYHARMSGRIRFRWAWRLLAYVSLGLGVLGVILPGLPTTPFILVAAWAAARGSPRLQRRLLAHPHFGPMIRNWRRHGAVARRSKQLALATMALCALLLAVLLPLNPAHRWWMTALPIACMAIVATWLWRRPEPPGR